MSVREDVLRTLTFAVNDLVRIQSGDTGLAGRTETALREAMDKLEKPSGTEVSLDDGQCAELLKAIALRLEYSNSATVEYVLLPVAKQIEAYAAKHFNYKEADKLLAEIRYPIKRVTVTFYDRNPKPKP